MQEKNPSLSQVREEQFQTQDVLKHSLIMSVNYLNLDVGLRCIIQKNQHKIIGDERRPDILVVCTGI